MQIVTSRCKYELRECFHFLLTLPDTLIHPHMGTYLPPYTCIHVWRPYTIETDRTLHYITQNPCSCHDMIHIKYCLLCIAPRYIVPHHLIKTSNRILLRQDICVCVYITWHDLHYIPQHHLILQMQKHCNGKCAMLEKNEAPKDHQATGQSFL